MSDPIAEAITEHWGERCPDFDADCPACQAWSAYDDLVERREQIDRLTRELEELREAAEPFTDVITEGDEDRLPSRDEAKAAARLLLRCNGHDLDVWGAGDIMDDSSRAALGVLAK